MYIWWCMVHSGRMPINGVVYVRAQCGDEFANGLNGIAATTTTATTIRTQHIAVMANVQRCVTDKSRRLVGPVTCQTLVNNRFENCADFREQSDSKPATQQPNSSACGMRVGFWSFLLISEPGRRSFARRRTRTVSIVCVWLVTCYDVWCERWNAKANTHRPMDDYCGSLTNVPLNEWILLWEHIIYEWTKKKNVLKS